MECNREEALRAREIAAKMLAKKDFLGARRIALKVQRLFPGFENIHQLLTVCEVHCAAMTKNNEDLDWYSILQVEATADETIIRKQYDKLAFWLHPDKNTHSGAEIALKLVSEACKILCDRKERSLYDSRRQYASKHVASKTTQLTNKTGGNRSHEDGRKQPPAFVLVFWTICPHCRRRFVYYKRNFLVTCDNCDKLFYAFKLHEQAMPSSFLSNSVNNAEVSPGKISYQQHGVTDQQTGYTKDCSTGGNTSSERTMDMDAARIDEHRERDDRADEEDNHSETRSDVVQFSEMNEAKSSAPVAEKESVSNMTSVRPDPSFISTQNLRSEDASVVPDTASSCSLQRLGKRKQDDGPDCIHGTDSSNYKRHRNHDSSAYDQISNGSAAVAESKSSEHHAFRVDNQDGGIASNEANQQSDKEASGSAPQKLGSPVITYHYPDFFDFGKIRDVFQRLGKRKQDDGPDCSHSTDSSSYKRQSNHNSPSSAYEQVSNGNAAVAENKSSEHHALSRVDIQDGGIASHEANQQSDKEASGSAPQKLGSPVITYHYPDFFDFGKIRDVNQIAVDQIWALYDNLDGMPRIYAQIKHIDTSDFRVQMMWLEYNARNELEANWNNKELPLSCGNFCLRGETNIIQDPSLYLSHRVPLTTGKNGNSYEIYPNKGEVWALYKRWSSNADNCVSYGYDVVEVVSDGSTSDNVIVSLLIRIEGFVSLFTQAKNKHILSIPSSELLRFSHCIPFYRTNGNERVGVAAGLLELDTAALPSDLETAFPSITLDSCMPSEFTH